MTIQFPDRSNHDGQLPVVGLTALISKATEGTSFVDSTFHYYRDAAAVAGIPYCAYHFLHDHDIAAQAGHAFSVIGPEVPVMLDWEKTNSGELPGWSAGWGFIQAYRALGGLLHLAYLPKWFWALIGSPDLRPLQAADVSIVSSNYPPGGYSENGPGWNPYGGVTPAIWQYQGSPDWNAYKGTQDQLWALFHGQQAGDDIMKLVHDTRDGKVWTGDGVIRRHIANPEQWTAYQKLWGVSDKDWYNTADDNILASLGVDVATLVDVPGAGLLVPHNHATAPIEIDEGQTGPAVPIPPTP
jgi:hypothetical protein